jgi:lipopolysaccharide transport system permease protein
MIATISDKPYRTIEPSRKWVAIDFKEFYRSHELLFLLTLRDVKLRYKQTALGVIWAVLQPVLTMIIFTVLFGRVAKMPSDGAPYAIFAYSGLLPWTYFANGITNSSNALVLNSNLISKVYFSRLVMPTAAVLSGLVDLGISFVLLFVLFGYYHLAPTWNILALPLLVVFATLFALSIGLFFSALNVKYRDVRHALPFVVQLGMFVTPIIYPLSMIPQRWRWLVNLNPMSAVVEGFRSALLGTPFHWESLLQGGIITLLLLIAGAFYFRRMEKSFADII